MKIVIGTSKHNSVKLGQNRVRHSGSGVTTIGSNLPDVLPPTIP